MSVEHSVIKQIAYVVDDLDAAIARWVEVVRAGPFFRIDGASIADVPYRGQPVEAQLSLAIGNSGGVQIELIAPQGSCNCLQPRKLNGQSAGRPLPRKLLRRGSVPHVGDVCHPAAGIETSP